MRMGFMLLLAAALAIGCQNKKDAAMTAEQKRQAAAQREAEKRAAKQREADAKAQREREAQQKKEDEKQAKILAKQQKEQAKIDERERQKEARETEKREAKRKDELGHEMFVFESRGRFVDQFTQAQAAAGAYEDSMLGDAHFDGPELNSLGRYKLNLILQGAKGKPATIYLASADKDAQPRGAAVDRFWKSSPHSNVALTTKEGYNLNATTPANATLNGLRKLEKMSEGSGGSPTVSGNDTTAGRGRLSQMVDSLTGGSGGSGGQ